MDITVLSQLRNRRQYSFRILSYVNRRHWISLGLTLIHISIRHPRPPRVDLSLMVRFQLRRMLVMESLSLSQRLDIHIRESQMEETCLVTIIRGSP
jgi:hypothetical protein